MPHNTNSIENREFLHDLATPMTVLRLIFKRLVDIQTNSDATNKEKCTELINKGLDQILKMEHLHSDFKAILAMRDCIDDKKTLSTAA